MLIGILSGVQVFLCLSLIIIIYFAKPDTSGLSSLAQNSRQNIRFRPMTKLILIMVIGFFANSIFLNKIIARKTKDSSIVSVIEKLNEKKIESESIAINHSTESKPDNSKIQEGNSDSDKK